MKSAKGKAQHTSFGDEGRSNGVAANHQELLSRLRTVIRARHYSLRTEPASAHWMQRFVAFHARQSPRDLGPQAVKAYLEDLAVARQVSASTQHQALNALVFLYEQVMGKPLGTVGECTGAKRPKRLPVVLSREEVNRLLGALSGSDRFMAGGLAVKSPADGSKW